MKQKIKDNKRIFGVLILSGLFVAGGSAVLLDVFGQSVGEGDVDQSITLNEIDGTDNGEHSISYTMDDGTLSAGDIYNHTFEIENRADSPLEIEYNNSVDISDDNGDGLSDVTASEYITTRVPVRYEPIEPETIQTVGINGTVEELVSKPLFYRVNVVEGSEAEGFNIELDLGDETVTGTVESLDEGVHTVEFTNMDSYSDSEEDQSLQEILSEYGSQEITEVRLENVATEGTFELHEFRVNRNSEFPDDFEINVETVPSEDTVERTQVTVIDTYLRSGLTVESTTEVIPPTEITE